MNNFEWNDLLACEWAGYIEERMKSHRATELPEILRVWKENKMSQHTSVKEWEVMEIRHARMEYQIVTDKKEISNILEAKMGNNWYIHSVRRLSDNTIWTVGDEVKGARITKFSIKENVLYWWDARPTWLYLDQLSKPEPVKEVLFKDHVGNEIYKGDKFCVVQKETFDIIPDAIHPLSFPDDWVVFKDKSVANEFCFFNKPTLSINEVMKIYANSDSFQEELKQFAKSKHTL